MEEERGKKRAGERQEERGARGVRGAREAREARGARTRAAQVGIVTEGGGWVAVGVGT
jgi:hypothetical protein